MAAPAKRTATLADIEALPDHVVGEILAGELHTSPRPASRHARAASVLSHCIGGPFDYDGDEPGGWLILMEPELHLGPDVLVPDLAGWRRERMPEMPDTAAFQLAPDWVCEVLSPSTASVDRTVKMNIYRREAVGHVWLVDPDAQVVEVFRLDGDRWLRVDGWTGAQHVRAEPFDAIELDLAVLWSR